MKKALSLILALTLCVGLTTPSLAAVEEIEVQNQAIYHTQADMEAAEYYAEQLNNLGLFRGTGNGYELERPLRRIEALVMLVRLLGQEGAALSGNYSESVFTDMASANWSWAWPYVGYAYEKGITYGTGDGNFEPELQATPQMYVTFILRCLGYGDVDTESGDLYSESLTFGQSVEGLLTNVRDPYHLSLDEEEFWRADAVDLAFRALASDNVMKDGGSLLSRLFDLNDENPTNPTEQEQQPATPEENPADNQGEQQSETEEAQETVGIHHAEITVKDHGVIKVELDGNTAPITVANFMKLAKEGYYNGLTFHRMVDGFMIQGGQGAATETIKGEFAANGVENDISHVKGVISMARANGRNDSASSQFFITIADATFLDGDYAAFGHVTEGIEIAEALAKGHNTDQVPLEESEQPVIESVVIVD